ncbi:hypothetical protein M3I53_16570 [Paraburkholderia sp. CNPSo 3272]|uniref:hypothetical protein n=1 Tax=Paraburkholderia sp. CNPSo 3272 TaxID=2940931 RepID=UPI0020B6BF0F|nr:hypothetical protein [Paraburkholderia sp. CNPSo 3272]MCP3724717.1 hypothetical protein [Paraburkholderia sp. CNPSo 3272]
MAGSSDIEVLRVALKEAEDELCDLGSQLVNDGWDTTTTARTLDVLRIALYGTDGAGSGIEGFEAARKALHDVRAAEAAASK